MFADPENNVQQLNLAKGSSVVDLGAGTGHYSFAASTAVGPDGIVYAVDVQKDILDRMVNDAHGRGFTNIKAIWGNIEKVHGTRLRDVSVDTVIFSNTLFQVEDKDGCIKEIYRILKTGGRLLLIDWSESFGGLGPQSSQVITENNAKELFEKNGFTYDSAIDAGAHHYGLIFKKS
jgi:ubiquinone/menaquinone biosynthesis C-methylase UbiE